jgi:hypothetical protein
VRSASTGTVSVLFLKRDSFTRRLHKPGRSRGERQPRNNQDILCK